MQLKKNFSGQYQYFPFIDGLRALAVTCVIIYHLHASWLPGGFVGVDVFFVISGFVVSASVTHFNGSGFWRFLAFFYARRFSRILPALVVCLFVSVYVSALFIPASWLSEVNQKTGLFAFFGFSNIILATNGRDYFGPVTEFNPFTHTWSLAVEEQFYLIFPVMFFAWLYGNRGKRFSIALFFASFFISIIFSSWQSHHQPTEAFFLSPGRLWELASGVLLYQVIPFFSKNDKQDKNIFSDLIGVFSFILLLVSFFISKPLNFPMPGAVLTVISTLGIIFSLYKKDNLSFIKMLLENRFVIFLGKMSYSLYLWHWPIFVFFRWTYGLDSPLNRVFALVITLLLAALSYYFIEVPVRKFRTGKKLSNVFIIIAGLSVIILSYCGASTINTRLDKISLSVVTKDAELWYPDRGPATPEYPGCRAEPKVIEDGGAQVMIYKAEGCQQERPLKYGVLHVIGDSHTVAYTALFKQFVIRNNLEVDVYANGGCPFISLQPERDIDNWKCRQYTEASLRALHDRVKTGDVIFLASLRLPRFGDQWVYFGSDSHQQSFFSSQAQDNRQRSINYAIETLGDFNHQGIHVVFEAPKPIFQTPPYRCSDWFNHNNPICIHGMSMGRELLQKYRAPVLSSYSQIIKVLPTVSVWDPFSVLCSGAVCNVWDAGHSMFFDGDHLSSYGSMKLLPDFSAYMLPKLTKALPSDNVKQ